MSHQPAGQPPSHPGRQPRNQPAIFIDFSFAWLVEDGRNPVLPFYLRLLGSPWDSKLTGSPVLAVPAG
eukprot:501699-Heterocapsa_arctica.AAC.1